MFEKKPLFIPALTPKSSTVDSLPSSIPVTRLKSLFWSYALILSIIEVGRFLSAVLVSPVMNSLPLMSIFLTSLPLIFIVPSSDTSAPGSFFTKASIVDPSATRNADALY